MLAAAGRVVEGRRGGPLTDAAAQYERAARELFGATPAPTPAGRGLRHAGRLLSTLRVGKPSETAQLRFLLAQLVALTDAVARLRETQNRAAQAAAARGAADHLHTAAVRWSRPAWTAPGDVSRQQGHPVPPVALPGHSRRSPAQPAAGRHA